MKKISLLLGIAFLLSTTSCCKKDGACEKEKECCKKEQKCCASDEKKQACAEFKAKWDNFESLTAEEKEELVAKRKSCIDDCNAKMKASLAEIDSAFIGFDELAIDEKKALLDDIKCPLKKKCNKKEATKCCKKEAAKDCPEK